MSLEKQLELEEPISDFDIKVSPSPELSFGPLLQIMDLILPEKAPFLSAVKLYNTVFIFSV